MDWKAFLFALPLNALFIYSWYLDNKDFLERKKRIQNKLDNLKKDNIYIDLTSDEKYMLDSLTRLNSFDNYREYIRNELKSLLKEIP